MFNPEKLQEAIAAYKKNFSKHWPEENYKWEAIQQFQEHWNIDAPDFSAMFEEATSKTYNLLASYNYFPRGMILKYAAERPEQVRSLFRDLYDESQPLTSRINHFARAMDTLHQEIGGTAKNHFQKTNAITTYLWLRYPDNYYIYKYSIYKDVAQFLNNDFIPKRNSDIANVSNSFAFYDKIRSTLQQDKELIQLLSDNLPKNCYADPSLHTLTFDFGYFISKYYKQDETNSSRTADIDWRFSNYDPKISVQDWLLLLHDPEVFNSASLQIMKRLKDMGGAATCTQLAEKYGELKNFYNSGSSSLACRIYKKTHCPLPDEEGEDAKWWPILYTGRSGGKETQNRYIWKLRDELSTALDQLDLSSIPLYANSKSEDSNSEPAHTSTPQYWWLTANPRIWSFASISVGNEQSYTWYNENGRKRRIFQNFVDVRPGDKIIGYESTPTKQITTLCTVIQNENKILTFRKDESLSSPIDLSVIQDTPEFSHMEFLKNPLGSLFRLSETEYSDLLDLIRESNPVSAKPDAAVYTKSDFLRDVFLSPSQLDELCELLFRKRNLILQGAPGVGKTYAAKKLAYVILGKQDDHHIQSIQFHQNYSYEDFIMGYKPTENGFVLKKGIFYTFCQQAANHPDEPFFFLIDEINRGNISKIFGELLMLIEKGYRNVPLRLAYDDIPFSVPDNVYLIGMMNTADRSLALIDYALRRRFSFFTMAPSFASKEFQKYTTSLNNSHLNQLVQKIQELNQTISEDDSLGNGFLIGHSYFCGFGDSHPCTDEELVSIIRYDILPLLEEYWFDDQTKVQEWSKKLTGIFNDK